MKIRFDHPATVCLSFAPGDEIQTDTPSPGMLSLLSAVRIDGVHVARVVKEAPVEDVAVVERGDEEAVVPGKVARRGVRGRTASVS